MMTWEGIKGVCNWLTMIDLTILITMFGAFVILAALKPEDDKDIEWHFKPFRD